MKKKDGIILPGTIMKAPPNNSRLRKLDGIFTNRTGRNGFAIHAEGDIQGHALSITTQVAVLDLATLSVNNLLGNSWHVQIGKFGENFIKGQQNSVMDHFAIPKPEGK